MMKLVQRAFLGLLLAAVLVGLPQVASAGRQDFTIENQSGLAIIGLYVTPTSDYSWQEDILGGSYLRDGEAMEIEFSRYDYDRYWDIMIEFADGYVVTYSRFDLFRTGYITVYYDSVEY